MQQNITLELVGARAPLPADGDATRLAQATSNLLVNAAKFTDPGGRVTVILQREGERARLRVRDTGAGMDEEMLSRLFQPFSQADATLHRASGGLGLGLSVTRAVVELHGGTVSASSEGPGRGAEFSVTLPLARDAALGAPAPEERAPRGALRVLVIEDNQDSAESLRDVLELAGHEVVVARDGQAGIGEVLARDPDVVLCDLGLPDLDGYEVARRLRASRTRARLVALTGYGSVEDVERARQAGFDEHLLKPPDLQRLGGILASSSPQA